MLVLGSDLRVRLRTSAATEALYRLNPSDDPVPAIPAAAYNVAAALIAEEQGIPVGPPWSRVHLGSGQWVTLRAARIAAADTGEADIAVSIEAATPAERLEVFALAHGLSRRERQVLAELTTGADTHVLARRLVISEHTSMTTSKPCSPKRVDQQASTPLPGRRHLLTTSEPPARGGRK